MHDQQSKPWDTQNKPELGARATISQQRGGETTLQGMVAIHSGLREDGRIPDLGRGRER
jgi:hypothetical protein